MDIGCGIGGPARYLTRRFSCKVDGLDITESFVDASNSLAVLVGLQDQVKIEHGDGQNLPYADQVTGPLLAPSSVHN